MWPPPGGKTTAKLRVGRRELEKQRISPEWGRRIFKTVLKLFKRPGRKKKVGGVANLMGKENQKVEKEKAFPRDEETAQKLGKAIILVLRNPNSSRRPGKPAK